jgi:hypothetical protein
MNGCYNGVRWVRRRLCDAMYGFSRTSLYYWPLDSDGDPVGCFRTLRELQAWVDSTRHISQPQDPT